MTVKALNGETVTVSEGDTTITVPLKDVTALTVALLAARKDAYAQKRTAKTRTATSQKAARAKKKAAATAARIAKLQAELAKLAPAA